MDKLLDVLQNRILGKDTRELSAADMERLFALPASPMFNMYLHAALGLASPGRGSPLVVGGAMGKTVAVDKDAALLAAITKTKTRADLLSVALCLRSGANPNLYVNAPGYGVMHVLAYAHVTLAKDKGMDQLLLTVALLLLMRGSSPSMMVYDDKAGTGEGAEIITTGATVAGWLAENGYETLFDRAQDRPAVLATSNAETLKVLSLLLNDPEISKADFAAEDVLPAIRSFASRVLPHLPIHNLKRGTDYVALEAAVDAYNLEAYAFFLAKGQEPSYLCLNKMLYGMTQGRALVTAVYEQMLRQAIDAGVQLDQDQSNVMVTLPADVSGQLREHYAKPYWKKTCSYLASGDVPAKLRGLAYSLNIDATADKKTVCGKIEKMAAADPAQLKAAAMRRKHMRAASELSAVNEFLTDATPALTFRNASAFGGVDPLEYNDWDLVYYKDAQGAAWVFTSNMFPMLLSSGVNPHNNTRLPGSALDEMRYKLGVLQRMGIDASTINTRAPRTFDASVDALNLPDAAYEDETAAAYARFLARGSEYGVAQSTLTDATKEQLAAGLAALGVEVAFDRYPLAHARVTAARIVDSVADPRAFYLSLKTYV